MVIYKKGFNVNTWMAVLFPAKMLSAHLVEELVVRSVEVSEPLQNLVGNVGMWSAFWLPQTSRPTAALWLFQAWEPFGLIEIEVFVWYYSF